MEDYKYPKQSIRTPEKIEDLKASKKGKKK
jgi:hypothetical protein